MNCKVSDGEDTAESWGEPIKVEVGTSMIKTHTVNTFHVMYVIVLEL